jgi:RNA polymerase sigma-70 factor (ECF subfamily)
VQADKVELSIGQESRHFEAFFEHEYPRLVRLLFAMTADLHEADELAQDAMSRTWERWDRVSQMASPAAYTFQIALNLQRKRVRGFRIRARRILLIRPQEPMQPHVPGEVVSALAMLPTGQRAALLLVEWIGMTANEASQILGITTEGVRTRIHRARETLRRCLEDHDG